MQRVSLTQWIREMGVTRAAENLGVTPRAVSYWMQGHTLPTTKLMQRIVKLTKGRVSFELTLAEKISSKKKGSK